MGYYLKGFLGAALFFGGVALFNVKLVELLETGTCASGNVPYEIAQGYECPEGTGTDMLLLTGSIFAGLIGAAIYAFRGESPRGSGGPGFSGFFGAGTFAWGFFFAATGAVSLYTALTNDTIGEDGELGGMIVGVTFLLMGVPALVISLWGLIKSFGGSRRDERPPGLGTTGASAASATGSGLFGTPAAAPMAGGSDDALGKIERLNQLRKSGALTESEFEREKSKVLGG